MLPLWSTKTDKNSVMNPSKLKRNIAEETRHVWTRHLPLDLLLISWQSGQGFWSKLYKANWNSINFPHWCKYNALLSALTIHKHFQDAIFLCFKVSLGAQPFIWKLFFLAPLLSLKTNSFLFQNVGTKTQSETEVEETWKWLILAYCWLLLPKSHVNTGWGRVIPANGF